MLYFLNLVWNKEGVKGNRTMSEIDIFLKPNMSLKINICLQECKTLKDIKIYHRVLLGKRERWATEVAKVTL